MNFSQAGRRLSFSAGAMVGVVLLCVTTPAVAATNTLLQPTAPELPDVGESLLRVFGALVFVLALFLGGVWFFRHLQSVNMVGGRARKLNILEVRPLGGRQAIYVVGYADQRMLVSSSASGVQYLRDLPDEAEPAPEAPPAETKPEGNPGLAACFKTALAKQMQG